MESKIMMLPENNNNGFLGNGFGGGVLGFILGLLCGNGGWFGNGFGGGNGAGYAVQANNTDLIMQAINGTDSDIRLLATTLNADVNETRNAINAVQGAIAQVGAQNGMGFLQVVNAIQSGNAAMSRQLCECCCENRLLTTQQNYENRIQGEQNTRTITDAINNQSTLITKEFCELKERELQNKIDALTADNALLRSNANNAMQTAFINEKFAQVQAELAAIKASQPATITVPNNNWTAVPTLLANAGADFISSYWANRLTQAVTPVTSGTATPTQQG